MIPLHLGALHPVEQAATVALAFGPFVVLGIVIALRRRAERDEQEPVGPDLPEG
ncbi:MULTISPECIES: hypothetical protein [Nocardioides]|uniref:Uncharacterized protein n=1 Tax=Nocardioides vastitatis TaxID=2568655 RepID=A0ABW0ZFF1_9ACTN|nr:hypothetical protein [Nocardioides sp.]